MACYLRVYGDDLNVIELLEAHNIKPSKIWKKGLPRFKSAPSKLNSNSGFNVLISGAEWDEFEKQKLDALKYLEEHKSTLSSIAMYSGVDSGYLDFGIEWRDVTVQCDSFPPNLIKLVGQIGFGIELSQYTPDEEDD
ncbi:MULTISPECIES: hypothetical protein [Alteromonadaceae]|uniref:DUF4279 domain-containing protein n=1 Tax=Brumicola blandensis TaxID=3075611 RepID=A0AAW8R4Y4_9ALTE|nr:MULTISPECIES: hypothetical protein [unclassified Alteromonas]MDT0584351.1 hypothetical protein [Alteromonas sp. W409]MDT0630007.1 hypothetical protein [Alteromonas sp. W364]